MRGEVERVLNAHGVRRVGEDALLVACSGGLDSIVLADVTCEIFGARRVVLGHVDHAARAGSDEDAAFVEAFSRALGARFRSTCLAAEVFPPDRVLSDSTPAIAKLSRPESSERGPPGPSASASAFARGAPGEARLRELRYEALERQRRDVGANFVLTAHTLDDQAETVLFGLTRSTRLSSLRGIPQRRGAVLRPMLGVTRREIRAHAAARGLAWREDPTNREPYYLRNRIRKELLPLLESRYRPGLARRLARLAGEASLILPLLDPTRFPLDRSGPRAVGAQRLQRVQVSEITPVISCRRRPWTQGGEPLPPSPESAVFDADALERPVVRLADPGERIRPIGMDGRRKISDVLREAGIPAEVRPFFPVVASGSGAIVWVPGVARSRDAPVGPLTRHVWVFWMRAGDEPQELQGTSRSVTLDETRSMPTKRAFGQDDE